MGVVWVKAGFCRRGVSSGLTVVCTAHQPSSAVLDQFIKMMLSAEGCTLYFGDREGNMRYFLRLQIVWIPFASAAEFFVDLGFAYPKRDTRLQC